MASLAAYMNGEKVGTLVKLSNGAHQFQYARTWVESPLGRPLSLSLPLQYQTVMRKIFQSGSMQEVAINSHRFMMFSPHSQCLVVMD